ncbi:hypothetical protein [Cellulosimicrobium sp. TH-20]|uniref:hypothetical protein n=1 Tax=Cellulosimicrobium sp. TH-20 TaxID=1980001 RepID=UPI00119D8435|nr:hypothetical protein [Cellulosimicrobium sp. TH-20]
MTTRTPEQPDDADLERLRAADPAADATPDATALEAAVRDRVPEAFARPAATGPGAAPAELPAAAGLAGADGPTAALVDELAERRARRLRRRAPLQVAAAVVGALVIGTGGYALGAGEWGTTAGDSAAESTALAPIRLGSADAPALADALAGATATEESSTSSRATTDMAYPGGWGGRTVFHAEGLSSDGARADAWAYDAAGVFSQETARRVADVLGVTGEVREEYGSYAVGPADWTGPTVSLQPDGLASVSFNDPAKDPWGCVVVTPMPAEEGDGAGPSTEPGTCEEADHGAPPSGAEAGDRLREVLGSLGLDADGYEIVAEEQPADQGAPRATTVTAAEVVDGQSTGTQWSATYSGAGLASLYGSLAPRVAIGAYDVVSPAEAVERLGDPRFGGGGTIAWAREDVLAVPETAPEPEVPTVPPTVGEGARFAWPVTDVTITDARLGLAVQYQPDGAAVLLPAYELSDADGNVWSVVAVVDDQLDFTPSVG